MRHGRRFARGFALDPSCVLYLPLYRYGAEQQKIWDQSSYGNHGTIVGAVPSPKVPMLTGLELVVDGAMTDTANWNEGAGWAVAAGVATATLSGATLVPAVAIVAEAGKRYRIKYTATVTAGSCDVTFGGTSGGNISAGNGNTIFVVATTTGTLVFTGTGFSGTLDDVSIQEVLGYTGPGWYFDGVDDQISVPDAPSLRPTSLTWLQWFWAPQSSHTANPKLACKATNATDATFAIYLYQGNSPPQVSANAYRGGAWGQIAPNVSFAPFMWNLYGVTYDPAVGGYAYLNGSRYAGGPTGSGALAQNAQPVQIGGGIGEFGKFQCGEALLSNRVWSDQEIRNYYELTWHRYS